MREFLFQSPHPRLLPRGEETASPFGRGLGEGILCLKPTICALSDFFDHHEGHGGHEGPEKED